jgi:hypothetical protein
MGRKLRTATAKADSAAPSPSFKAAARAVTRRPAPKPRRGRKARRGGGQGARSFTAGALAEDYLRLCRDPLRDLQRWMDEDKKRGRAGRGVQLITRRGEDAAKDTTTAANYLAQANRLRGQPLPAMQGRLDADRAERGRADGLLARPRAGAGRYDGLQPVRAAPRAAAGLIGGDAVAGASFRLGIELDAVSSYYAAKIAAVKRGLSPRDIAGAVRAVLNEQAGAVRAVLEKWNAARTVTGKGKTPKAPTEARAPMRPASGRQPT